MDREYMATVIHSKCGRDVRECVCSDASFTAQDRNAVEWHSEVAETLAQIMRRLNALENANRSGLAP